jgi:hypothetical protein
VPTLSTSASLSASQGDPHPLRNGFDRPAAGVDNGWTGALGDWVQYTFEGQKPVKQVRLVFDSDLNRKESVMPASYPLAMQPVGTPATLTRAFRIEALRNDNGWQVVSRQSENHQRLVRISLDLTTHALRFIPEATWGAEKAHLFAFEVAG